MGEMGWICKRLFDQGMGVGGLERFPSWVLGVHWINSIALPP
jgi:hypothetical protein